MPTLVMTDKRRSTRCSSDSIKVGPRRWRVAVQTFAPRFAKGGREVT